MGGPSSRLGNVRADVVIRWPQSEQEHEGPVLEEQMLESHTLCWGCPYTEEPAEVSLLKDPELEGYHVIDRQDGSTLASLCRRCAVKLAVEILEREGRW